MAQADFEVLIVGGGQAGLAGARQLSRLGVKTLVVDAHARTGDSWRNRYRSLTLFTPREFSQLDGLKLDGDQEGYPSASEFADYLERYAKAFELDIRHSERVISLTRAGDGRFLARLGSGDEVTSRAVLVASGGFQRPVVPAIASGLAASVRQLNAETYRDPSEVGAGSVLVVGDGASGRDIAVDLAGSHSVLLASGRSRRLLPERILGRSTWRWLRGLGLLNVPASSPIGRIMRKADPFPNRQRGLDDLRRLGIDVRPRAMALDGHRASFSDGSAAEIATVIWTLGYRDDSGWMDIPGAVGPDGSFLHKGGLSPVRGLFHLGRPWQRNRASALVLGVSADAQVIAGEVVRFLGNPSAG